MQPKSKEFAEYSSGYLCDSCRPPSPVSSALGLGLWTDTTPHLYDMVPLHGLQNDPLSSRDMQ